MSRRATTNEFLGLTRHTGPIHLLIAVQMQHSKRLWARCLCYA